MKNRFIAFLVFAATICGAEIPVVSIGNIVLSVTPGNTALLTVQLQKTTDLVGEVWVDEGDPLRWEAPMVGTEFFRVQARGDYEMDIYTPTNAANLKRALLWQYEKAENLKSLIGYEQTFFDEAVTNFWDSYRNNTFNLDTADDFGLRIWGFMLGVERPNYDSYVPVTVSSDAVPAGLQPSTTWSWSRLTVNGERIYYDPTETYAIWTSATYGMIISAIADVGNELVQNYFVYQYYPDEITASGAGDAIANGVYTYVGFHNSKPYWENTFGLVLFWDSFDEWVISQGLFLPPAYTNAGTGAIPDKTGWVIAAAPPTTAPTLAYLDPAADLWWGHGTWSGTITLSASTENIPFADEMYRQLLKSRLMLMQMTATIPNINAYMEFLFPDNIITVTDGLDMTITYRFLKAITDEETAVLSVDGVLPRPAGVKSILVLAGGEEQFGFEGQYRLAADPSTQQGNFDNSTFAAE